jgi:group II intron reverse transcriptase/maturase
MCKKQQLRVPDNEEELRQLQDDFYKTAREGFMKNELVGFKNLKEIAFCKANIITAIHKLKANKGSRTPGVDDEVMRENILEQDYEEVITRVMKTVDNYISKPIRRVYIPKAGSNDMRPIGIQCLIDKIVQECIRNVIEPILEAQFFDHNYGFRPLRDAHQAYERVKKILHGTGYHWVLEGDITQFFDNVNHNVLTGALYHMGIKDRRILQMIKVMLRAGIMNEIYYNDIGTPQGGILSPLLANVYLNKFDNFIVREWEEKKLKNVSRYNKSGKRKGQKSGVIQQTLKRAAPNMKPAYLIRYADDWVIVTNTLNNAKKLKSRIHNFLKTHLKLELSDKKTRITNVKKKAINFLGFLIRARAGKSKSGLIIHGKPDKEKFVRKVLKLKKNIHDFKKSANIENLIHKINLYNCRVRGILNYYKVASHIYLGVSKIAYELSGLVFKVLRSCKAPVKWIPADETRNLTEIHKIRKQLIPAIKYKDFWIGVTNLNFVKWELVSLKNPKETIYTAEGRELYRRRTGKQRSLNRKDLTLSIKYSEIISHSKKNSKSIYNFEFFMNRGYVYNVDKGRCRVCGNVIEDNTDIEAHHINLTLPMDKINRVQNLATVHSHCHNMIHSSKDFSNVIPEKMRKKVLSFRSKLREQKL